MDYIRFDMLWSRIQELSEDYPFLMTDAIMTP
jgi:hypothetical protein